MTEKRLSSNDTRNKVELEDIQFIEKRFGYGAGVNWQEDVIIDYETEKSYNFYEVGNLLNELNEENNELKQKNKKWIKYVNQLEIALKKMGY